MGKRHDTSLDGLMEHLIEGGAENIGTPLALLFELAKQIERVRSIGAQHYKLSPSPGGYANYHEPKWINTSAGMITGDMPKTVGYDGEPFYPQLL